METLGDEPAVIAQGRQMKNFVPLAVFLRRNPNLSAIQTAIAETVAGATGLASITPKTNRVIRTEPVAMSDGRMHAVHVWCGPPDVEPPERPVPGPAKWDLTDQVVTDTAEMLINAGMDPAVEPLEGRSFADDFVVGEFNADVAEALARTVDQQPGLTYCTTWQFVDKQGMCRRLGLAGRGLLETMDDGSVHLIGRGVNLLIDVAPAADTAGNLAKRIIEGLSTPGSYRGLMDMNTATLLKWLDEPCPFYNWRDPVRVHPEDREHYADLMHRELKHGSTSGVLRLPGDDGGWVPIHMTITRVELEPGVYSGLFTVRLPTDDELADVGLDPSGHPTG